MKETTHTPGPWRIGDAGNTIFGPKQEDCSAVMIASVLNARGDKKANARLIAAAPDILKALVLMLKEAENSGTGYVGSNEALEIAQNAITKATGRQS